MKTYLSAFFLSTLLIIGLMPACMDSGKLQSITVTPDGSTIVPGINQQFRATAHFSDGTTVDWTAAADWTVTVEDGSSATIGNSFGTYGLLSSAAVGTYTVRATDAANQISGTAVLSVLPVGSIQIIPAAPFMPQAASHQFSATTLLSNGTTYDLTTLVTWSVPPTQTVATVTTTGLVSSLATGTTDISALYSTLTNTATTAKLTVTDTEVQSVIINEFNPEIFPPTTTQQFTAKGDYSVVFPDFTSSVVWSSSDTGVASIDSSGLATAGTRTGTTTITALDPISGKSGTSLLVVH